MSHHNARLTFIARLELVGQVQQGWTQAEVAKQFRVSRATVSKWLRRFRQEGEVGLNDRSSRPRHSPTQTPPELVKTICATRTDTNWGPHRIGWHLKVARSTVYAVLRRSCLHRRDWLHRTTRTIIRYEKARPGEMLHLDVKKLARIPDGGGRWTNPGTHEANTAFRKRHNLGWDCLHVAVDDYSRYAYVEALEDERAVTTVGFLRRAVAAFAERGVTIERILTDNGANYTSAAFKHQAQLAGIRLKRTRPYRPQTNGKAEAFNKILQNEWAYLRAYRSNEERLTNLQPFLLYYNEARPHGGLQGSTPTSRL